MVRKILSKEQPTWKRSDDTIVKEINLNKERIMRLQDNYEDGHLDTQKFQETSNRYKQQLQLLEKEKRELSDNESTYQKCLKNGIDLLTDIKRFYNEGDYAVKHAILGSIFPEKLFFEKNNCRTTRLNEALRLILNTSKFQRKKKTDNPSINSGLSVKRGEKRIEFEPFEGGFCIIGINRPIVTPVSRPVAGRKPAQASIFSLLV